MPDDVAPAGALETTETASEAPTSPPPAQTIADAAKGAASSPKPLPDAPWSKDLAALGINDPDVLAKFDSYLREKIQPRTTQLEQKSAGYDKLFDGFQTNDGNPLDANTAAQMASELLNGLASDPEGTVRDIMQLMALDPAKFAQVKDEMEAQQEEPAAPTEETNPELDWVKQQMLAQQHAKEDEAWANHITEMKDKVPGFNEAVYTLAMAQFGPDPNVVMEWYNQNVPAAAAPAPASPTLGESNLTPVQEDKPGSLKDEIKRWMAEDKLARQG